MMMSPNEVNRCNINTSLVKPSEGKGKGEIGLKMELGSERHSAPKLTLAIL